MKAIAIVGATGMVGSTVYDVLRRKYNLILVSRDPGHIKLLEERYGGIAKHRTVVFDAKALLKDFVAGNGHRSPILDSFLKNIGDADYVINAMGILRVSQENCSEAFFVNGAWPHILAQVFGPRLIHIATDGVYNGREGFPYDENSPKTPVDLYGLSKSLGEPTSCLTLRTSIIGRELHGFTSLLEWFLKQGGKTISGFANHFWNGITTREFGKICDRIISNPSNYPQSGLYHVFSEKLSKYEMLVRFREKYNIDCDIKIDYSNKANRTLTTIYEFNEKLKIPNFDGMLGEL